MGRFHDIRFPGESNDYRDARDDLMEAEIKLRKHVEDVAKQRRALPPGGALKENYVFEEGAADLSDQKTINKTSFSHLFEDGKDDLVIYSFMYAANETANACPMCTSLLDSLNGGAPHLEQRINLAVVAKAPIHIIREWARTRNWNNLRILSSAGTSYNADYFGETPDGNQIGMINVFSKIQGKIQHTYNSEMLFVPAEEGQNPRHVDAIWPLWNVLDLTQGGRGSDWYPQTTYD